MHFLFLLDKRVVLGDPAQGELVHEIDLIGSLHILVHEGLNDQREGGAEEHDLSVLGQEL